MDNKIVEYERFVNDVLRNDLNKAMKKYEITSQRLSEYLNVKLFIEEFKSKKIIKTQSDLGSNFYVQCKVENKDLIFVDIGMGFYMQMTFDEAIKLIEKKKIVLEQELNEITNVCCKIKANIKIVLQGLAELQGIQ